jgi:hypothetical protein
MRDTPQFIYATLHKALGMTYAITHHITFCIWRWCKDMPRVMKL